MKTVASDNDDGTDCPADATHPAVREGRYVFAHPEDLAVERVRVAMRIVEPERPRNADEDETRNRARVVVHILERLDEELFRLECIAHLGPDDVNAISSAKGFVQRAEQILKRGLGL